MEVFLPRATRKTQIARTRPSGAFHQRMTPEICGIEAGTLRYPYGVLTRSRMKPSGPLAGKLTSKR